MPQAITFDRFDGGLLLARPSSIAPANSLANLFNMDVQPGGWLRSRANWRRTPQSLAMNANVKGLYANGGYLWSFVMSQTHAPTSPTLSGSAGNVYTVDSAGVQLCLGFMESTPSVSTNNLRIAGVTPWLAGFIVTARDLTAGAWLKARFDFVAGALSRTNITDANMPNSGLMVTIGSRVFAISDDGKEVKFCAVGDPTDWTTSGNAGFLPVAQHFGSGSRAYGLGVYQGKLAVFTDKSIQLWTVDPDPTAMAIDNVINGIGTRHHGSIVSLNGDLLFLSDSGIRSLTTLQSSLFPSGVDLGLPVDSIATSPALVLESSTGAQYSTVLALGALPFSQYWVHAPDWTFGATGEYGWLAWSYSRQAKLNAWAWHGAGGSPRAKISGWAVLGNKVYARTDKEAYLLQMAPGVFTLDQTETGTYASCAVSTQWLDFGKPGQRKALVGIDFDGVGVNAVSVNVSVGGDRTGYLADTIAVGSNQSGWTYSGELLPVNADGTEFRISFSGGGLGEVQINRFTLYWEPLEG